MEISTERHSKAGSATRGTLFKITPAGALTTLVSFTGTNGDYPRAGLLQGPDGYLYGVACEGGTNGGYGTAFKMNTSGSFAWIYSFSGSNGGGKYPNPGLALGPDGNFIRRRSREAHPTTEPSIKSRRPAR